MTDEAPAAAVCAICGVAASATAEPPRRTLARGADSGDPSFSVIAVLPNVDLCAEHADDIADRRMGLGWCDDARCRVYGEAGSSSPCGKAFTELKEQRSASERKK